MEIKKSLGDFQCFGSCKQTVHHFVRLELPKCCRAHMFSHVRFFKYNHYNTVCSLGCQSAVGVAVSISCVCVCMRMSMGNGICVYASMYVCVWFVLRTIEKKSCRYCTFQYDSPRYRTYFAQFSFGLTPGIFA